MWDSTNALIANKKMVWSKSKSPGGGMATIFRSKLRLLAEPEQGKAMSEQSSSAGAAVGEDVGS